jgi:Domain of unknown function (DUF4157)
MRCRRLYPAPVGLDETQHAVPESERLRRPPGPDHASPERLDGPAALERIASAVGNRGFTRAVARMRDGEGILPGGAVHPDIEAAIAASRGTGRPLDIGTASRVGGALGDSFGDVRVHTGDDAAALARSVSARAFTVGSDIFFGSGEYRPGSSGGGELLAHELAHVVQQRGAAQTGPLTVSQPGDALEREAEAAAREI